MFEWKVNLIRVSMLERVLNHMEKQGYEVQSILQISSTKSEQDDGEFILAGKKQIGGDGSSSRHGMPALTPENIDVVYGRKVDGSPGI